MKKLLLATAVAALSVSAAQAAPTVYGKAFLTLDTSNVDTETTQADGSVVKTDASNSGLNSNGSRIGFKGSEALTANTDVVYKLEYGINVDNNNANALAIQNAISSTKPIYTSNQIAGRLNNDQFYSRDTYLGLSNKTMGTFLAGRLTTIDDNVDFTEGLNGSNVADIGPTFNEPRADNALAYVSPSYNGLTFLGMYAFDSDTDAGSLDDEDQYGVAATYGAGQMNIGGSYIGHGDDNHVRVSGNYAVTPMLTLGALYQVSEFGNQVGKDKISPFPGAGDKKENTLQLSVDMDTNTPWNYYAKLTMVDNVAGADNSESMGLGFGGEYSFTKAATGHVYAGYLNTETGTKADKNLKETDGFGIGAGLEYVF